MEWKMCANDEEIIRKCEQVRELYEVRDRCGTSILNKDESNTIIEFYVHIKFLSMFFFYISQMCNVKCE